MASYVEPREHEPCSECAHLVYDSFHDESWCGHKPKPDGLNDRVLIGSWGHCEFWESAKRPKEELTINDVPVSGIKAIHVS